MLDRPARFVVCDGDIVEPKNRDRQNFVPADVGENKARVLAERYSTVLGMETEYVPNFIEKLPDLMELIEPKEWEQSRDGSCHCCIVWQAKLPDGRRQKRP